jgi:hypothetical protein
MNMDTGLIRILSEGVKINPLEEIILERQMTKKQKTEMKVSKHDNRSELGKLFALRRKQRRSERRKATKSANRDR